MDSGDVTLDLYEEGRSAWPSLTVEYEVFRTHCERVLGKAPAFEAARFGVELYLCCACAHGNLAAMSVVERRHSELVQKAVARVIRDADLARETAQEFWQRLFSPRGGKIATYSARGPLDVWMRVVATRLALDRCRKSQRAAAREVELGEHLASAYQDPDSGLLEERYTEVFRSALRRALAELSDRERNLLRMHVVGRAGIDEIGLMFGVHRATAARWLHRMRRRLRETAREHFARDCPGLTASEFLSVARALGERVELSLPSERRMSASYSPGGAD
jgi:RNA polymerase sigma-70 factor (ECF subfamily)